MDYGPFITWVNVCGWEGGREGPYHCLIFIPLQTTDCTRGSVRLRIYILTSHNAAAPEFAVRRWFSFAPSLITTLPFLVRQYRRLTRLSRLALSVSPLFILPEPSSCPDLSAKP